MTTFAEIMARVSAATPGPWVADPCSMGEGFEDRCDGISSPATSGVTHDIVETDTGCYGPDMATAEFIAHARYDVPLLLEALKLAVRYVTEDNSITPGFDDEMQSILDAAGRMMQLYTIPAPQGEDNHGSTDNSPAQDSNCSPSA